MSVGFQRNAFQNTPGFQTAPDAPLAQLSVVGGGAYMRWDAKQKRVVAWRPDDEPIGGVQRIRRLSELDPPQEIAAPAIPEAKPVDLEPLIAEAVAGAEAAARAALDAKIAEDKAIALKAKRRREADFLLMMD